MLINNECGQAIPPNIIDGLPWHPLAGRGFLSTPESLHAISLLSAVSRCGRQLLRGSPEEGRQPLILGATSAANNGHLRL
eukprot:scaffold32447_cov24-Prasinocladus_malaysianus.AAC.1